MRVRRSRSQSGKEGTTAQLRDGYADRAHLGIELLVTVAVAGISSSIGHGGVISTADAISLGREDLIDEISKHLAH